MEWAVLTLLASLLWSVVVIIDKYVSSKEVDDFIVTSVVSGFFSAITLMLIPLFTTSPFGVTPQVVFIGIITGMIYRFASTFYYAALKYGEASVVDPLVNSQPLFVLVLSFFLFGEVFSPIKYLGIFLMIAGAISLSIEKSEDLLTKKKKFKFSKVFFFAIFAAAIYGLRTILMKFGTMETDIWSLLFWVGVGIGITSWILVSFHHPRLTKENVKGIKHLGIGIIINTVALICYTKAVSLGPVTLVSTVMLSELLFVFMIATFLSFIFPRIMKEAIQKEDLARKIIAIAILVVGLLLIL
ncbi:EamA family transporter [Bacteroidota bacterium]